MNFYISNSKNLIKKAAFLILLVFIVSNVVLDIALQLYVNKKTNKYSFVEEKISKSKHMKLQDNAHDLDMIFIGSSRTIYHISTEQFKRKGIEIYNFGVSDRGLVDYPYMVKEAISLHPKIIIISIEVSALYKGAIGNYKQLTWEDLKYIFKFENIGEWGIALKQYILGKHLLFQHSEPINIRVSRFYHRFDPKGYKPPKVKVLSSSPENNQTSTDMSADCKIFDYNYPSSKKIVTKCTNGDGIIFGSTVSDVNRTETFSQLNKKYVVWLNTLLDEIKNKGIEPVLVLEPVFKQHYTYDQEMIRTNIHAEVIDLTKMQIEDKNWADNKHVNIMGRKIYTDKLIKILTSLMHENNNKSMKQ